MHVLQIKKWFAEASKYGMALYTRYQSDCQSLKLRSASIISFQDQVYYEEQEEYIKSYYTFPYLKAKQKQLLEYYRYHQDIPRFFIEKITDQLEIYHEKQREIRYKRIKKQLGMQIIDESKDKVHFSFKALKGISELQTTRQLFDLIKIINEKRTIQINKTEMAKLIDKQKQDLKILQNHQSLKQLLGSSQTIKNQIRICHTLSDIKQNIQHKKQLTLFTECQANCEERNEFYKRWSTLLSHRQLQIHRQKIKSTLLNKKKSLK